MRQAAMRIFAQDEVALRIDQLGGARDAFFKCPDRVVARFDRGFQFGDWLGPFPLGQPK